MEPFSLQICKKYLWCSVRHEFKIQDFGAANVDPIGESFPIYSMHSMGIQKERQRRITYKALSLVHDLPCVLYQPHAMGVMEIYGGRERELGLHRGLHSDSIVSRESPFGHL